MVNSFGNKLVSSAHASSPDDVVSQLDVTLREGLDDSAVFSRRKKWGTNTLPEKNAVTPIMILLRQFKNVMVLILVVAALLSWFLNHPVDAVAILVLVSINIVIGFYQEFQAEKAITSLKKLVVHPTTVRRNGELVLVKPGELVPGDVVLLEGGAKVPADSRIIVSHNLQVIESALTGESTPVEKQTKAVAQEAVLGDRKSMVYMGTLVASGTAEVVVVATAQHTELGQIAQKLDEIKEEKTHYDEKTQQLAKIMSIIAIGSAIITFFVGFYVRNFDLYEMVIFTIATLVSALPESLPIILVIVLVIGAQRMARRHAIVRRLSAIETLGVVSVILTDKTGTLTLNQMRARQLRLPDQEPITVQSPTPSKQVLESALQQEGKSVLFDKHRQLELLLQIAGTCHSVKKGKNGALHGDPTEIALYSLAAQVGFFDQKRACIPHKIDDLPFVQDLKLRACLVTNSEKETHVFMIGAPEVVIARSTKVLQKKSQVTLESTRKKELHKSVESMTAKGMRVLAVAHKKVTTSQKDISAEDLEDMVYVGAIGMIDPPRAEIKSAIKTAHQAGIRVIMTTGDHPLTAKAIAEDVGLLKARYPAVLTESDVDPMSEQQLAEALKTSNVFARLSPTTKLRIAKLLQKEGHIVAMTGDGVNDAPALKQANVGISMGRVGTDVAREASEIVLTDDNFASIINAVREGRTQFSNVRRTSAFLIITNVAESVSLLLTLVWGYPLPLLPIQILWLNIITGGLTDFALATEPSHDDVMKVAPRTPKENIMTVTLLPLFLSIVIAMVILVIGVFGYFLPDGVEKARTAAFTVLSVSLLLNMVNLRALHHSVVRIGIFSNKTVNYSFVGSFLLLLLVLYVPALQRIFSFVTLSLMELLSIIGVSLVLFFGAELIKTFFPAGTKYKKVNVDEL